MFWGRFWEGSGGVLGRFGGIFCFGGWEVCSGGVWELIVRVLEGFGGGKIQVVYWFDIGFI